MKLNKLLLQGKFFQLEINGESQGAALEHSEGWGITYMITVHVICLLLPSMLQLAAHLPQKNLPTPSLSHFSLASNPTDEQSLYLQPQTLCTLRVACQRKGGRMVQ